MAKQPSPLAKEFVNGALSNPSLKNQNNEVIVDNVSSEEVIGVPDYTNVLSSMKRNPTDIILGLKPSLFFSKYIFCKVFYKLYVVIFMLLSLAFLIVDLIEEGPVLSMLTIITLVFIGVSLLMFVLETYHLHSSNSFNTGINLEEWLLELFILICHVVSIGFAFYSAKMHKKVRLPFMYFVMGGVLASCGAIAIRLVFFWRRCVRLSRIINPPEHLLLLAVGKTMHEAVIQYEEVRREMQPKLEMVGAKWQQELAKFNALDHAIQAEVKDLFV